MEKWCEMQPMQRNRLDQPNTIGGRKPHAERSRKRSRCSVATSFPFVFLGVFSIVFFRLLFVHSSIYKKQCARVHHQRPRERTGNVAVSAIHALVADNAYVDTNESPLLSGPPIFSNILLKITFVPVGSLMLININSCSVGDGD